METIPAGGLQAGWRIVCGVAGNQAGWRREGSLRQPEKP